MLDIIGSEDFFGDMDFKLCGTSQGVTGYQLDLKLPGVPLNILNEAIDKAKEGRTQVLDKMNSCISKTGELSPNAPQIVSIKISPDKIGAIIGTGGKTIRAIQEETESEISIEEDGTVNIYSNNLDNLDAAKNKIELLTEEAEVGKIYTGIAKSITSFGAFVEILPEVEGLIHISELADFPIGSVEDILNEGDKVTAKCIGIDDKGKVKLSRKEAMLDSGETDPDDVREAAIANFKNLKNSRDSRPRFNKNDRNDRRSNFRSNNRGGSRHQHS